MSTYQQTTILLDGTREAGLNEHVQAVMTVQDVADALPIADATVRDGIKGDTAETITQPSREHRQMIYPAWPTSTPGPEATLPPPGQRPMPTRTDQMFYECYDQERGMPCVALPERAIQESERHVERVSLPDSVGRMRHAETHKQHLSLLLKKR